MAGKQRKIDRDPRTGELYARIMRNGVSKRFKLGKDARKARSKLIQIEKDVAAGKIRFDNIDKTPQPARPTGDNPDIGVGDLIKLYLQWVEVNRADGTLETKAGLLAHFDRRYGQLMVSEITQLLLAEYYAWAKKERGTSENGGIRHMREVKTLLNWGVDMDLCEMPVRKFPVMRHAPPKTKKFTDQELVVLLKKTDPDFRDMIVFGLLTGLRPQELRGLTRNHIREQNGRAFIVMERHKTSMSARTPKPRCVPLSRRADEILARQFDRHPTSPHIFLNGHGKPYTAGVFRQRLERACVRAGIPKRPPYAMRHYFGTKRAGAGLNQTLLSQVMGHTTPITTTRYVDEVPEYHQKAMDAMADDMAFLLDEHSVDMPAVPNPLPPLRIFPEPKQDDDQDERAAGLGA